MKPISLTDKQKDKLLEMCRKLFPEYGEPELELEPQYDGSDMYVMFNFMKKHIKVAEPIHWFEFCMTHLAKRMLTHNDGESDYDDYIRFSDQVCYGKHPIDYLYEQFLKIK